MPVSTNFSANKARRLEEMRRSGAGNRDCLCCVELFCGRFNERANSGKDYDKGAEELNQGWEQLNQRGDAAVLTFKNHDDA